MKIAFDGQLFLGGNKTGIAWNAHNLIKELAKYPENECIIQCFILRHPKEKIHMLQEYEQMGCTIDCCRWFQSTIYKLLWNFVPIPYKLFFKSKPDITQFFNFIVPPGAGGKRVTIIHDMAYKSCPQTVNKKTRRWLQLSMKKTCRHMQHVITVSEFSKREIVKYLGISPSDITVVPNAVDHTLYHADYSEAQILDVLQKYQIQREYFLYLGTIEPRKNLERLIVAYAQLCDQNPNVPPLVLAGGKGWLCEEIYAKPKQLNIEERVQFIGYVSEEEAPILMCGAKMFLFPSLYEGFGMPPLEAMACGTPVITSNTTSLPEVVGNAGITVNPESVEELVQAMKQLNENDVYREELEEKGRQRAAEFTWSKSAEMLMDVYKSIST